jgi:hypothetical protein
MKLFNGLSRRIDRLIAGTLGKQLLFFGLLTVILFLLLFLISVLLYPADGPLAGRFWTLMMNFLDVGGYEDTGGVNPLLIFIVNIMGILFFGGVLVSLIINILERRIEKVREGRVHYDFNDHILVIGFDPLCPGLVSHLAKEGTNEIVVQTSGTVAEARRLLFSGAGESLVKRITVISGNRTSPEDLRALNLPGCAGIYLLGEQGEMDRDSQNIESLKIIAELLKEKEKTASCYVLIDRQATFAAFQQQDISGIREYVDFMPFNFRDLWAKKVFVDLSYNKGEIRYIPLDREPIDADSEKHVHLVILGMTSMGIALGIQAAHICHFPNFFTKGIKTRITFIDKNAKQEKEYLFGALRNFFNQVSWQYRDFDSGETVKGGPKKPFTDLDVEFINGRFEQEEVQKYLAALSGESNTFLTIACASGDQAAALAAALYLPEQVYTSDTQILVRQELSCATVTLLSENDGERYKKYRNLRPFGMLANSLDFDRDDDLLPMMIKYTYDKTPYDAEEEEQSVITEFPAEEIRRNWVGNWKSSDNVSALKASNRYCANCIDVKRRSLGIAPGIELTPQQIHYAARMEHSRWLTEKLLIGFRAPSPEERKKIKADKKYRALFKERLIHEDIKSYDALGFDDKNIDVRVYDKNISCAFPFMIKAYEESKGSKS